MPTFQIFCILWTIFRGTVTAKSLFIFITLTAYQEDFRSYTSKVCPRQSWKIFLLKLWKVKNHVFLLIIAVIYFTPVILKKKEKKKVGISLSCFVFISQFAWLWVNSQCRPLPWYSLVFFWMFISASYFSSSLSFTS